MYVMHQMCVYGVCVPQQPHAARLAGLLYYIILYRWSSVRVLCLVVPTGALPTIRMLVLDRNTLMASFTSQLRHSIVTIY